ncbi:hypothetical protein [Aquimarina sp. AU58]|uniref:hypothetical protein n=1 Tax=Aquimarina sp. AU58 TaxID=1874112 RepID=UPI000D654B2C|nr:hypothetical protein [Aquimarina sp. AU58]
MDIIDFIELTNEKRFYQKADFHLTNIQGKIDLYNTVKFDFTIEYQGVLGQEDMQMWTLTAHRCHYFHNMFQNIYLPYIKLRLLEEHPLLWNYKSNIAHCELIGYPKDINTFLGQIYQAYIKVSGNWIQATEHFFATEYAYKENGKKHIQIPENLSASIEQICQIHDIDFQIMKIEEQDKYKFNNVKVLILGNEDISPYDFNLKQPYIIADDFFANKL